MYFLYIFAKKNKNKHTVYLDLYSVGVYSKIPNYLSIKRINVKQHGTKFLSNFVDRILNYSYQMLCFF